MKKLFTFLLCFVFLLGAFGLVGCGETVTESKTEQNTIEKAPRAQLSVQSVSAPRIGGKALTAYSTRSGQTGVSKRISATVEPASAQNKLVDYRVFWIGEGEHAEEPVTDYVIVEQDSDGSTDATVTCIQAFGDDTVVVQVVTRDGGYTAECVVTYAGFISEMSITSPTLNTVNTTERGDYYELYTNQTYTFNVNMDNALHSVGTYDLSVETGGVGEFWFYPEFAYGQYDGGSLTYKTGWYTFNTLNANSPKQYSLNDIVNQFITVSINVDIITVQVNTKELFGYYIATNSENHRTMVYCNSAVYNRTTSQNVGYSESRQNAENLPSAYFTVTVTDAHTNISETIKIWVEAGVDSVALSAQNLEF